MLACPRPAPCVPLAPLDSPSRLTCPRPQPPARCGGAASPTNHCEWRPFPPATRLLESITPARQVRWFCRASSLRHLLPNPHLKVTLPLLKTLENYKPWRAGWLLFFYFFFASADLWVFIGSGNASESFLGVPRGQSAGRVGVLEAAAVPFG